mmetsp:Transcript_4956/g.12442  ORF Transcript_4956/g.12442 Transcript_4956/m.12442 type:complete len:166 (+) Transcript_4956:149-646(+)|eukprot:jgi/Tetstr1/461605/TSEL_006706.t1
MASELSRFIDEELGRTGQASPVAADERPPPSDTDALLKERRREALRTELESGRKRRIQCNFQLCLLAIGCIGILLLMGAYISGRSSGGEPDLDLVDEDSISNPFDMFSGGGGADYYDGDYGGGDYDGDGEYDAEDGADYFDEDYEEGADPEGDKYRGLYEEDYEG